MENVWKSVWRIKILTVGTHTRVLVVVNNLLMYNYSVNF